jgi:hypothetical protein
MFANGTTSSTDITFASQWLPCGSEPHGCGEGVTATPSLVTVGNQCVDSGVDAVADAPSETAANAQADAGADG